MRSASGWLLAAALGATLATRALEAAADEPPAAPKGPPPAAAEAGKDVVTLRDGSFVRGTVTVRQQVESGEPAKAREPEAWSAPVMPGQTSRRWEPPGGPLVHIESDNPRVELRRSLGYKRRGDRSEFATTTVCTAPCDERVDLSGGLVFDGPRIVQSKVFAVEGEAKRVNFHVRAGSAPGRMTGYILFLTGFSAFTPGVVFTALPDFRPTGVATLLGGAALTAVGFGLFYGCRTTFKQVDGGP